MAKSRKDIYENAKQIGEFYSQRVENFKTPFVNKGVIGDVITNTSTENPLTSTRDKVNKDQMKYFKDLGKRNFKYGLEVSPGDNGDEDPVVFGFDIIIKTQDSPLFSEDIISFFDFGDANNIKEIIPRREIYNNFIEHLSKFFKRTDSEFSHIKTFYIKSVNNLENLINQTTAIHNEKKQFTDYGKESENIQITMYEDTYLNAGYLAMLYNTLAYSKINGKQIIPENLLRFDISIVISEIRQFNKVLSSLDSGINVTNIVNDNVSRYIYNLYDCQFNFDKMSHPSQINNETTDFTNDFIFNIFYKFSTMEMEKFKLNIGEEDERLYINNENKENLRSKSDGNASNDADFKDFNYRSNNEPYIIFDSTGTPGNRVNTLFTPSRGGEDGSGDETSIIDSLKEKERSDSLLDTDILSDETKEKSGIGKVIDDTKRFAQQKAKFARDKIINDTFQKIRTATGLRRINAPTNIYKDDTNALSARAVGNFAKNQIHNFANSKFTDFVNEKGAGGNNVSDISKLNDEYNKRILRDINGPFDTPSEGG